MDNLRLIISLYKFILYTPPQNERITYSLKNCRYANHCNFLKKKLCKSLSGAVLRGEVLTLFFLQIFLFHVGGGKVKVLFLEICATSKMKKFPLAHTDARTNFEKNASSLCHPLYDAKESQVCQSRDVTV